MKKRKQFSPGKQKRSLIRLLQSQNGVYLHFHKTKIETSVLLDRRRRREILQKLKPHFLSPYFVAVLQISPFCCFGCFCCFGFRRRLNAANSFPGFSFVPFRLMRKSPLYFVCFLVNFRKLSPGAVSVEVFVENLIESVSVDPMKSRFAEKISECRFRKI
jgi:hypothetical protein